MEHSAHGVDVRRFGAQGDGKTMDTGAISEAIAACAAQGGGRVVFPPGNYLTGAVVLESNTGLHLESGAALRASTKLDDYYTKHGLGGLVVAKDAANPSITGTGVIHGSGHAFIDRDLGHPDGPVRMKDRPGNLITFSNCTDALLEGIVIEDAPFWTVHMNGCDGVSIRHIRVRNNPLIPNNDGIHCSTSSNVRIVGCVIAAGDDAIAITGIDDHAEIIPGFVGYQRPALDTIISGCVLSSRSSGIRIGYGNNDVRRCIVSDTTITASNRGIAVFVRDPGNVTDVFAHHLRIETRLMQGPWWGRGEPIHVSAVRQRADVPLGEMARIHFSHITAESETGVVALGCEESPIKDLGLAHIGLCFRQANQPDSKALPHDIRPVGEGIVGEWEAPVAGVRLSHVEGALLENVRVKWPAAGAAYFGEAVAAEHCQAVETRFVTGTAPPEYHPES